MFSTGKMKKIIVVKIGRSIATTDNDVVDIHRFDLLAKQIKKIQRKSMGVILVISGSVTTGRKILGTNTTPISKNLYAAVGQSHITSGLFLTLNQNSIPMGQMLLTKSDLKSKDKIEQIRKVIFEAVNKNVVMVLNENDTVDLGSFSGNDFLATKIAKLIKANVLVLLTDVEGIYNKKMVVIEQFRKQDMGNIAEIKKVNSKGAVGGIRAKIRAAIDASNAGVKTIIASGKEKNVLLRILIKRESLGTKIL